MRSEIILFACLLLGPAAAGACAGEDGPPPEAPADTAAGSAVSAPAGGVAPGPPAAPETAAVSGRVERYVGARHPPLPRGVRKLAGGLAIPPGQPASEARHSFQEVRAEGRHMLWLSELTGHDERGVAHWRVRDAVEVSIPGSEETLLVGLCRSPDGGPVAALVRETASSSATTVRAAWGVDRERGRLVPVEPDAVACLDPGAAIP